MSNADHQKAIVLYEGAHLYVCIMYMYETCSNIVYCMYMYNGCMYNVYIYVYNAFNII